jgi:CRP/FNR family cyclic AMP-dependent transcriptional regulator
VVNRGMTTTSPVPRPKIKDEARRLGAVPTFADAPGSLLSAVAKSGYIFRVGAHWPLLIEQTVPDRAYILLEGTVDVRRAGTDLGTCRAGEILGELGIVKRRLRTATVLTHGQISVLQLSRAAFEELLATQPYFQLLVGEAVDRKSVQLPKVG